ncbi:MAG: transglycosylase SLT domain-containing protein [bacterium]
MKIHKEKLISSSANKKFLTFRSLVQDRFALVLAFAIISCPSPGIKEIKIETIPEPELLYEAERAAPGKPIYAFNLLKGITNPQYRIEKSRILLRIYLDQREYSRALFLIDSLKSEFDITEDSTLRELALTTYLRQKNWNEILNLTMDPLLRGIALYNLQRYSEAIEYLSKNVELKDYQLIYLARCYYFMNDFENALKFALEIDTINPYLSSNYQNLLFDLLLNTTEISLIKKELSKIKDSVSRKFLLLKIYERQKDVNNLRNIALELITNHPSSVGAKYCIAIIKPRSTSEYKLFGRVAYLHKDYAQALKLFKNATKDEEVNYYLGMIHYNQAQYNSALNYFRKSQRPEAYYYQALVYENRLDYRSALSAYDLLITKHKNSKYATRALKRKAFLLEDIGDTLGAIETFVRVKEKNTNFRAGFQLLRIGRLSEALNIFSNYTEPDFVYWHMKIKERLGESADSLKEYLFRNYPLSYYTLIRSQGNVPVDTTPLDNWLRQFGDTTVSFDHTDSLHLMKAERYFNLDEPKYALAELEMIEAKSYMDLIFLSKFCLKNRYDYGAIKFCLQIKKRYENNNDSRNYPLDFLKILYPVRYLFTISENTTDLWLILAIIWQESMFDPDATSSADARGLMQVIPNTGKLLARELGIDSYSLYEPQVSIKFGTIYLTKMLSEYNFLPVALAAYNAGPINVRKWLRKNSNVELDEFVELIPFAETRDYVRLTLARQIIYRKIWEGMLE